MSRKNKQLNQKDFEQIKMFWKMGLNARQIKELTDRATSTIYFIKKAETLDEYSEMVSRKNDTNVSLKNMPKVEVRIETTFEEQMLEELREIKDILKNRRIW